MRAASTPTPCCAIFTASIAASLPLSCAAPPIWLGRSRFNCCASTTVSPVIAPAQSRSAYTIWLAAGAIGDVQTPSIVKDFCWPATKSNPGLASGTLMIVPLAFGLFSALMQELGTDGGLHDPLCSQGSAQEDQQIDAHRHGHHIRNIGAHSARCVADAEVHI